jgi:putative ABC transport system permease protein
MSAGIETTLRDESGRTSATGRTGLARAALVAAEVAFAVMLLVGAGLMLRSLARLQEVKPGFSPDNVLTAQMTLPPKSYPDAPSRRAFWSRLLDEVRRIPGVTAAGLTTNVPFNGMVGSGSYDIVGYTPPAGQASPHGRQEIVGGDYFRAMQIPLVRGRLFNDADDDSAPPVVVIDEFLVNRYFRDSDPIGRQIRNGRPNAPPFTIVGVVGTINSIDLGQPVEKERIYYPMRQQPFSEMALVVKASLDPTSLVASVRAAVQSIDPQQPIADIRTMDQWIGRSLRTRQAPTVLLTLFGGVALVLSSIGIYGVVAFGVAQRTREFGIRQALGAQRETIVAMVLRQGARSALTGLVIGLIGAFAGARVLQSQLFGIGVHDPAVFAGATLALIVVALAACYLPARATTRIDAMTALREP